MASFQGPVAGVPAEMVEGDGGPLLEPEGRMTERKPGQMFPRGIMVSVASCGEWSSPITTELLVADSVRLGGIALDGGCAYWLEGRPSEGGRNILVCRDEDGNTREVVSSPFNVRTRVHEYGGGAFQVDSGRVWFVNFDDQRIYQTDAVTPPQPLTADGPWRYADMVLDADRGRLVCVREEHFEDGQEPANTLVVVDIVNGAVRVLAEGHDFYSSPCLSNNGKRLAWLTWDHPDMPWDASTLWIAEIGDDGALASAQRIAGGDGESVFQPMFRVDGVLFFVSDPDGWWNLHRWDDGEARCVLPMQAEFGRPQWQFGMSTYEFDGAGRIVCCYSRAGFWQLARLAADGGKIEDIDTEFTDIQAITVKGDRALIVGGAAARSESVALVDLSSGSASVLRESAPRTFAKEYVSVPEAIEFATDGGEHAHAFFYPPCNPDYRVPDDERPPLMVIGHGGPTGATSATLSLGTQFWTSRGFAVLDVNYRGSTGYGAPIANDSRDVGALSTSTTASMARALWRASGARTARGLSFAAPAPAATRRSRRSPFTTCSPPARATTASAIWRPSLGTPTSSSPTTWIG